MDFLLTLAAFVSGFLIGRHRSQPEYELHIGEQIVNNAIQNSMGDDCYLLKNITIPTHDGYTTQIDHILVSPRGIFVIETKHYTGWIFGSEKSNKWTQITKANKYSFQNPLKQNYKHIKELQRLMPEIPKQHYHSVVVFAGDGKFKTSMPDNVVQVSDLNRYLDTITENVLTVDQVSLFIGHVQYRRKVESTATDKAHVEGLKQRFGDKS